MAVDGGKRKSQKSDIRKRTPLEQAIAEQTSRRERYEARRRQSGFKKTTIYVREELFPQVQQLLRLANGDDAEQARFRELVDQLGAVQ